MLVAQNAETALEKIEQRTPQRQLISQTSGSDAQIKETMDLFLLFVWSNTRLLRLDGEHRVTELHWAPGAGGEEHADPRLKSRHLTHVSHAGRFTDVILAMNDNGLTQAQHVTATPTLPKTAFKGAFNMEQPHQAPSISQFRRQ
jgi:hypothetical protein